MTQKLHRAAPPEITIPGAVAARSLKCTLRYLPVPPFNHLRFTFPRPDVEHLYACTQYHLHCDEFATRIRLTIPPNAT